MSLTTDALALADVANLRAQLWDAGFRPVAVCNWNYPEVEERSRGKAPLDSGWQLQAELDPPYVARSAPDPRQLNTGILCRGLRPFDVDIDDAELAGTVRSIILDAVGHDTPTRYREGNSARCLVLCRAADGEPTKRSIIGRLGKVEVLGKGQQFVAFGRHLSGADLYWYPDPPGQESLDSLPILTEDQVTAILDQISPLIEAPLASAKPNGSGLGNGHDTTHESNPELAASDPLLAASALAFVPNSGPPDWEAWNRTGMALWNATGGSSLGYEAWQAWSAKHPAYSQAAAQERWQHYFRSPPAKVGAGTIFFDAERHGWRRPVPRLLTSLHKSLTDGGLEVAPTERKAILTLADLDALQPPEWLVQGLIPEGSLVVPYGPPKAGKSFILLSLGLHIAAGKDWFGMKVKAGAAVYIAGEGVGGLKHRAAAMLQSYEISRDIPFWIIPYAVNLRDPNAVAQLLDLIRNTIGQLALAFVVVDTLARAMPGADENSAQDVGLVIATADALKLELGCAVALVHHEGKDEGRGARGTSALRGAWDAALRITGGKGKTTKLEVVDQKDAESGQIFLFEMREVIVGIGRSSLVPWLQEPSEHSESTAESTPSIPTAARGRPAGKAAILLRIIDEMSKGGKAPCDIEALRREFYECLPGETPDTKKKAFQRAVSSLIERQWIKSNDPWITMSPNP